MTLDVRRGFGPIRTHGADIRVRCATAGFDATHRSVSNLSSWPSRRSASLPQKQDGDTGLLVVKIVVVKTWTAGKRLTIGTVLTKRTLLAKPFALKSWL